MVRILMIDDDEELCRLLKKCLESEGYDVTVCHDGRTGLKLATRGNFQLIILDVMMPVMDGMKVLAELRREGNTPVLMLSAKGSEIDKVLGLRNGADDYLTKPFSLSELSARVASLIRRFTVLGGDALPQKTLTFGELTIDGGARRATRGGTDLQLTTKEFELLHFLASHKEQVFTKQQIYKRVWEDDSIYDENNVMVHVRRLRKKLEPNPEQPKYLVTVWGMGYKFNGGAVHD